MKILLIGVTVVIVSICLAVGVYFYMPEKSSWADNYSQLADSVHTSDPIHAVLNDALSDGKLSVWEISMIHCGEVVSCRINNVTDVLLSPSSADMFAETVLASLQYRTQAQVQ